MIQLTKEDALFLENNGATIKFSRLKRRPKQAKGDKTPADKLDAEVISVPHAKIVEKTTKRVWIDWTDGDDEESAAANAVNLARKNTSLKPMTPIEAMQALGSTNEQLEAANAELEEARKKIAEMEKAAAEKEAAEKAAASGKK